MTHWTPAGEVASGGRPPDGRPDPAQGAYWDLDLLTPDDVCALLKVKKSWLYDAVEDGSIETIRLGKQLRFRPLASIHRVIRGSFGRVDAKGAL